MTAPAPPPALPVLDAAPYLADPGGPAGRAFVDDLRRVVHEIGFFHLIGHGVDPRLAAEVHDVAREFFDLPEADRVEIENVRSPQFRGYTRFGQERTNGQVDLRDQVDIGREQPAPVIGPDDPAWLRLRGPNLWPAALPRFRPVTLAWMDEMERVAAVLLRAMAEALGQPAETFDPAVTPPEVLLKVIRYLTPEVDPTDDGPAEGDGRSPAPVGDQGVGAHRDTGFLTFVHQDEVGGLEVELDGRFVPVPPHPGALVVNIGEMFQLVTQGYFRATVHRVVSPPPGTERISVAYFFNPKLEATLHPVALPPELAAAAPGGASADPGNPILANYGDNSLKVRLRAHPDVAERHHADLLASGRWASAPGAAS
jgi:isopenicillin N synthase-like dioxygenase